MIKKINKIKDFGVFKNFGWQADIPDFNEFNLMYGWNYSGKTTLSRAFRCLELGALHPDYLPATFEFEDTAGNKHNQQFLSPPLIRVFNSDFCRKNLQWDNENIEPIFMLGEDNAELQQQLKDKKIAIEETEKNLALTISTTQSKENAVEGRMTDKARTIGETYSWRPFTKTHFRDYVNEVKDDPAASVLSQTNFEKYRDQALSNERKPILSKIQFDVLNLVTIKNEVEEILHRQISAKTIQDLLNDAALSAWVEIGRGLHEGKNTCGFCGNGLSTERIDDLNKHFSNDFEKLKKDGNAKYLILKAALVNLGQLLPADTAFYNDLQIDCIVSKTLLETEIKAYNTAIESLIADLKAKADKPFERLEISEITDNRVTLESALTSANDIIVKNNKRTEEFDAEKAKAIEFLKYHYAVEFETAEKYALTVADIAKEREDQKTVQKGVETLKAEKLSIENQLSETVKGAEKVNAYLKIFFGKDDIRIASTAENKFILQRSGYVAKNLSEGEKTAISFAYFVTKLEEKDAVLADTIVYIDDPVSSLDSNHLFNIYAFILTMFFDPATKQAKSKQLFVSTHNFEFYNLMKMMFKGIKKTRWSIYSVERTANSFGNESKIRRISPHMEKFKSEYVYLFSLISGFSASPTDQFDQLYNLPNVMRRFVEVYLNFKFLTFDRLEEDIAKLIKDPIECEKVRKFIHYYSHGLSTQIQAFMVFPDLAECESAVNILLDSIKNDDPIHYQSLVNEISSSAPAVIV